MAMHRNTDYVLHLPYSSPLSASRQTGCSTYYYRPHVNLLYPMWVYIRAELSYFEDFHVYLELEKPHHDLEFLRTAVEDDGWGNVHRYNMELVCPIKVIEDQGDHLDMSSEEIEDYRELL